MIAAFPLADFTLTAASSIVVPGGRGTPPNSTVVDVLAVFSRPGAAFCWSVAGSMTYLNTFGHQAIETNTRATGMTQTTFSSEMSLCTFKLKKKTTCTQKQIKQDVVYPKYIGVTYHLYLTIMATCRSLQWLLSSLHNVTICGDVRLYNAITKKL